MIDNNCLMSFTLWQTGRLTKYECTSLQTAACCTLREGYKLLSDLNLLAIA
jgi:hypothetical protein